MFAGVYEKLERADYFLKNLETLAQDAGGLNRVRADKRQEMRANLDGFFFEIISAKDFFLQGINDKYKAGLLKDEATNTKKLKCHLSVYLTKKILCVINSLIFHFKENFERVDTKPK